ETSPGEQAGDAREHAWLVLDEDGKRVRCGHQRSSLSHSGAISLATLIASLLVPAATIGQTMASLCTTKSTTTGASSICIAFSMVASTSSTFSQRRPTQPIASASLTKSGMRVECRSVLEYLPS